MAVKPGNKLPNIEEILQKCSHGFTCKEYDIFVNNLQNPQVEMGYLLVCLKGLKNCVSLLGRKMEILVSVILKLDWLSHEPTVIKEYQSLLVNLVSAHTFYLRATIKMIVKSFLPKHKFPDEETTVDDSTRLQDEQKFLHLHHLLKTIIHIVPLAPTILVPLLSESFPYLTKHHYIQECYVRNLLHITTYLPTQTNKILEIIINRMVKLDVHAPRDKIEEAENKSEEEEEENVVFEMDEDDMNVDGDINLRTGSPLHEVRQGPMSHREANRLDILMQLMFNYIHKTCHPEGKLDWEATKKLYQSLLYAFDNVILPTHACCHVQFLIFYICSFKEQLSEGFIDYLWKKVQKPSIQPVFRQAAVAYIASFLARARFLSLSIVKTCMELMADWAHQYIKEAAYTTTRPDVSHHGPFYSVSQGIFYLTVFKHKDILDSKKGLRFLESLNLQTLVTCRLNPLRVCLPLVAKTFACVARLHQFAFCDTILEHNRRSMLPVEGTSDKFTPLTNINPLDSFFPFDPYVLSRSLVFIEPLYKEYDGNVMDNDADSDAMEEEEFYQKECGSVNKTGMSPSSWKSDGSDLYSYGTSPGFKNLDTM